MTYGSGRPADADTTPAYLRLGLDELRDRARRAVEGLADCRFCPRDCGVNRLDDRWSACKTGRHAIVGSHFPHFGEEDCLRGWNGSGTIFFSHCNLRCVFCFAPGTRVSTDDGLIPIERIFEEGSETGSDEVRRIDGRRRVVTREGRTAPVAKAFRHRFTGELVRVKPYCCPPLLVTPNHELFAASADNPECVHKIAAGRLTTEHRLVVPMPERRDEKVILEVAEVLGRITVEHKRPPMRLPSHELVTLFGQRWSSRELAQITGYHPAYLRKLRGRWWRGDFGHGSDKAPRTSLVIQDGRVRFAYERRPGIPLRMHLGERLAWLLGLYCAEGHVTSQKSRPNSHRVVFSFGHSERPRAERVQTLLSDQFGVNARIVRRRTTYTVEAGKASLGALLFLLCGKGARHKRVPVTVLRAGEKVLRAFLEGVAAGDGWDGPRHLVIDTVSKDLALGLYQVGLLLGELPTYHEWKPSSTKKIEGRRVRQSPLHYVKFPKWDTNAGRHRSRWQRSSGGYLVPIHRLERVPYDGPVYDLEVDDRDHSYVAPFVAASNCQNHSISQGIKPNGAPPGSTATEIADMALELQRRGCHNINFVTPEHVVPQVLEAVSEAAERGLRLPIVYNTSAYDCLDSLRLMDGVVDIYMPDFKFWSEERSRRYMKAADYPEVARRAILEMHRQVGALRTDEHGLATRGVIIRHLVMPGMLDETREILRWIRSEFGSDAYVNLMDQYYPDAEVADGDRYPEIDRGLRSEEFREAKRFAREMGVRLDRRRPLPRPRARHRRARPSL